MILRKTSVYKEFVQLNNNLFQKEKIFHPLGAVLIMRQYKNDTRLVISDGLLNTLDTMFPNKLPSFLVSDAEIAQLIGQQQVITWIKDKQEELRDQSMEHEGQVTIKGDP